MDQRSNSHLSHRHRLRRGDCAFLLNRLLHRQLVWGQTPNSIQKNENSTPARSAPGTKIRCLSHNYAAVSTEVSRRRLIVKTNSPGSKGLVRYSLKPEIMAISRSVGVAKAVRAIVG